MDLQEERTNMKSQGDKVMSDHCKCGKIETTQPLNTSCKKCPKCRMEIHTQYDVVGHSSSGCSVPLSQMITINYKHHLPEINCTYMNFTPKFRCDKGHQYCSGVWCDDHTPRITERKLIHSVQLWEMITGKKAPYTVKHVDSSHRISDKEAIWLISMEEVIEKYNPSEKGWEIHRAKNIGNFFEKT